MENIIIVIFIAGYLLIALEHSVQINKSAIALVTGVVCWALFAIDLPPQAFTGEEYLEFVKTYKPAAGALASLSASVIHLDFVRESLRHHLVEIAQILFFLVGAMTIVELVDAHGGFQLITGKIRTSHPGKLLFLISWVTFFLSALLDNLTTTIVMVSLLAKLLPSGNQRRLFTGMVVIAANAGGAWSPIGDVTTTMLWIGGRISTPGIIISTFLPSIVCLAVPLLIMYRGVVRSSSTHSIQLPVSENRSANSSLMFWVGVLALTGVPVFKTATGLPPFMGMMLALGVVWFASEMIDPRVDEAERPRFTAAHALGRIDMPSVLFFMGILLAVGALQSMSLLARFSDWLDHTVGNTTAIVTLIGFLSAIVDNVPLVAGSMGMYDLARFPQDSPLWTYLAYCAGTGGSILIIGSAAGVAAMGMEKIEFFWYLRKIGLLAILGYLSGAVVFLLQQSVA